MVCISVDRTKYSPIPFPGPVTPPFFPSPRSYVLVHCLRQDYDGGDCCECTCDGSNNPDDDDACGRWANFACIDPMAPCVDDDSVTIDMIGNCYAGQIGKMGANP